MRRLERKREESKGKKETIIGKKKKNVRFDLTLPSPSGSIAPIRTALSTGASAYHSPRFRRRTGQAGQSPVSMLGCICVGVRKTCAWCGSKNSQFGVKKIGQNREISISYCPSLEFFSSIFYRVVSTLSVRVEHSNAGRARTIRFHLCWRRLEC